MGVECSPAMSNRIAWVVLAGGAFLSTWLGEGRVRGEILDDEIDDEFALLEEDEVETASKHRQSIFWSPSAIAVYTREDIQTSGATTLVDFLRRVANFDVDELKPSYPLVGARALTEGSNNLVLVLVDGYETDVEMSGFSLWNALSFDLDEVERVEVIRGPGSTLYGANAFAAVVNITTVSDHTQNGGDLYLAGGSRVCGGRLAGIRGGLTLGEAGLTYSVAASAFTVESPSNRADRSLETFRTHGWIRYRQGRQLDLKLHAGYVQGDGIFYVQFGDMYLHGAKNPWVMGQADLGLSERTRLKVQLTYTRYTCNFIWRLPFRAYGIWVANLADFYWDSPTVDGQAQMDWQVTEDLLVIGGASLRYTTLTSPQLTLADDDELRGAGFLHAQWQLGEKLQLTGGLRLDLNTDTQGVLSPRAVAVFRPWPDHSVRLGYALAFRKPSHYESRWHPKVVKYNDAVPEIVDQVNEMVGNENLINEKVHSIEAGYRAHFLDGALQLSVDLFYNFYRDIISFVIDLPLRLGLPDLGNSTLRFENAGARVNAWGGEARFAGGPPRFGCSGETWVCAG